MEDNSLVGRALHGGSVGFSPSCPCCAQSVREPVNAPRWEGTGQASKITGTLLSPTFMVPWDLWKVGAEDRVLMWQGSWLS